MKIEIEIKKCTECPNFELGMGFCEPYCTYPDAPYNGECTDSGGIPDWCPRIYKEDDIIEEDDQEPVVILLNGYPRSGKDTFCEIAEEDYQIINYSTVDTVKHLAVQMGWDGEKDDRTRAMLSGLKDFYTEWFNGPYEESIGIIRDEIIDNSLPWVNFIIMHIREPEEIKRIRDFCKENDVSCCTVFLKRKSVMKLEQNNHADKNVENMCYDIYMTNNGTLVDFTDLTKHFLKSLVDGTHKEQMSWE